MNVQINHEMKALLKRYKIEEINALPSQELFPIWQKSDARGRVYYGVSDFCGLTPEAYPETPLSLLEWQGNELYLREKDPCTLLKKVLGIVASWKKSLEEHYPTETFILFASYDDGKYCELKEDECFMPSMTLRFFAQREGEQVIDLSRLDEMDQPILFVECGKKDGKNRPLSVCGECESDFYEDASPMPSLCPECAHLLYGYPRCPHRFEDGRCTLCFWNGQRSDYLKELYGKTPTLPDPGKEQTLTFPEGIKELGFEEVSAALECKQIEQIILPSTLVKIGARAFFDYSDIKRIVLNDSLEEIGSESFWGLDDLESLTLPATLKTVGRHAFCNCKRLTITVPFLKDALPEGFDKEFFANIQEVRFAQSL